MFSLFETKLHLLRELQSLALDQATLVSQHDMAALMSLLSRKQSVMESLQGVQEQLSQYRHDDPEERIWSSPQRRADCQAIVKLCEGLVQNLIVQENLSIGEMAIQRENLNAQMQQNAAASIVQRAYSSNALADLGSGEGLALEG